jgi:hypothetical protein
MLLQHQEKILGGRWKRSLRCYEVRCATIHVAGVYVGAAATLQEHTSRVPRQNIRIAVPARILGFQRF